MEMKFKETFTLLILFKLLQDVSSSACPKYWAQHLSKCYQVYKLTYSYSTAKSWCSGLSATLPIVESPEQHEFVLSLGLRFSYSAIWIGLEESSYFRWNWYDGSRFQWSNWDLLDGYPRLSGCCDKAAMYFSNARGMWQDYPSNALGYGKPPMIICEKKLASPSTPLPKWYATLDQTITTMKTLYGPFEFLTQCLWQCETLSDCIGVNFYIPVGSSKYTCGTVVNYETGETGIDMKKVLNVNFWMREKQTKACDTDLTATLPASGWTANSQYSTGDAPQYAHLYSLPSNTGKGRWRPAADPGPYWLQIDFGKIVEVTKIQLQNGYQIRVSPSVKEIPQQVATYLVMYSKNLNVWKYVRLHKSTGSKLLSGEVWLTHAHLDLSRATLISPSIRLRALRIVPKSWYNYISARVGVFGCVLNSAESVDFEERNHEVGLRTGDVPEAAITASSVKSTQTAEYPPWMARTLKIEPVSEDWSPIKTHWGGLPLSAISGDNLWLQVTLFNKYKLHAITIYAVKSVGFLQSVKVSRAVSESSYTFVVGADGTHLMFDVNVQDDIGVLLELPDTETDKLRIHVNKAVTAVAANIEVHGTPMSCSSSSPSVSSSSPCSCGSSSNPIWCTPSTTFDLAHIHSVSGVVFKALGSNPIPGYSLSHSVDGSSWTDIPTGQINETIISSTKKDVTIIGVKVTRYLKVTCSSSCTHCTEVVFKTCPVEACPPHYFLHGDQCYWLVETFFKLSVNKQQKICQRNTWAGPGHLVAPNDTIETYFFGSTAAHFPTETGWSGLRKTTNWFFPNQTSPAVGLDWAKDNPGSGSCSGFDRNSYALVTKDCTKACYGICQTKALVKSGDKVCKWIVYNNAKSSATTVSNGTYTGVTLAFCLTQCRKTGSGCSSAMHTYSTKLCKLLSKSSVDTGVQLDADSGNMVYELDCSDCQTKLIWGSGTTPLQDVKIKTAASSELKPATNAALGNDQGYWKTSSVDGDSVQIDLGRRVKISKVILQGGSEQEDCHITEFSLFFSNSTIYWTSPMDTNGKYIKYKTLADNRHGLHITRLPATVISRFVKIVPKAWKNSICLRFEIIGCEANQGKGCSVDAQSWMTGDSPAEGHLKVNALELLPNTQTTGITIAKVKLNNSDCSPEPITTYTGSVADAQKLATDIAAFADDTIVIGASGGDISAAVPDLINGLKQFGLEISMNPDESLVFMMQKGRMDMSLWRSGKAGSGPVRLGREIGHLPGGECGADVGMETGLVGIPQITWPNKRVWMTPLWSVVPSGVTVWEAAAPQYVTIDMWMKYRITGIIIQGGGKQAPPCWTKSISIKYSTDNQKWNDHEVQGTSTAKEYDASFDIDTAMKIDITPEIEGRFIRITPVSLESKPCFRFEILGCPLEGHTIDTSAIGATTSASQDTAKAKDATDFTKSGWCSSVTANTDVWLEIDTPTQQYMIRKIEVTLNDIDAIANCQIKWKSTQWIHATLQQYKKVTKVTGASESFHELHFSPVLLQKTLRILITPAVSQNLCVKIKMHGKSAPACVPGSVGYGDQCLYLTQVKTDFASQKQICQRSGLNVQSQLIMAKTYLSQQFIAALLAAKGYGEAGIGIEYKDSKWKWMDGVEATGLSWAPGDDGVGATHAFLNDQAYFKEKPSTAQSYAICQSTPLAEKSGVSCRWIFRPNSTLSTTSTSHNGETTLTCLSKCLETGDNCKSVVMKESTGLCQIFAKDRNTANLGKSDGDMYFEKFCADNCSASVFGVASLARLSASSSKDAKKTEAYSKLNLIPQAGTHDGLWQPATNTLLQEYIEVQLSNTMRVKAVVIQGQGSSYVTEFIVVYLDPNLNVWRIVRDLNGIKMKKHEGNWGPNLHYTIVFPDTLNTSKVRIYPTNFTGDIAVRWDVYGVCPSNASEEIPPLGFESGDIADWQLMSSRYWEDSTASMVASAARLNLPKSSTVYGGWRPKDDPSWIQVDLLIPHELVGITTQSDSESFGFTGTMNLSTSTDGATWTAWKAGTTQHADYDANFEKTLAIFTEFKPRMTTKLLRIYPQSNSTVTLRMELYGTRKECPNIAEQIPAPADTMEATSWINTCRPTLKDMNSGSGSCYQWCPLASDSAPALTVHFHSGYHVTKVIIFTSDVNANYVVEHSMDGAKWITVSKQNKTVGSNQVTFEFFTFTTQRHLKITVTPTGAPACMHLGVFGCPAKDCPSSYIRHGTHCFFRSEEKTASKDIAKGMCEKHAKKWGGMAHLANPSTPEKYYVMRHLVLSDPGNTWIGADQSGSTWQWTDGSTISWAKWEGGVTPSGNNRKGYINNDGEVTSRANGNTLWRYACQVPAAISDLQPTYNSWFYRLDWLKIRSASSVVGKEEIPSLTQCLHACQSGWAPGCIAVKWRKNKQASCLMYNVNRYNGMKTHNESMNLWEMFSHGNCGIPLLESVQHTVTAQNPSTGSTLLPLRAYGFWTATPQFSMEITFSSPVMMTSINTRSGEGNTDNIQDTYQLYSKAAGAETLIDNQEQKEVETNVFRGANSTGICVGNFFPDPITLKETLKVKLIARGTLQMEVYGCTVESPIICYQHPSPVLMPSGVSNGVSLSCVDEWTVFLRRVDPASSFDRIWQDYKTGFSLATGDVWIGLASLAHITKFLTISIRIDIWDAAGEFYSAEFDNFKVHPETEYYKLELSGFIGGSAGHGDLITSMNDAKFSTKDNDKDKIDCGKDNKAGWWYKKVGSGPCFSSLLTGIPGSTLAWNWANSTNPSSQPISKALMRGRPYNITGVNVAKGKTSWLFPGQDGTSKASYATDGLEGETKCAYTTSGTDPSWLVDLQKNFLISGIWFVKPSATFAAPTDLKIYIGSTKVEGNYQTSGYTLCKAMSGPITVSTIVACDSPVQGRYLAIQMPGSAKQLAVCETKVITTEVQQPLGGACTWNHHCPTANAECRPQSLDNVTVETFVCGCAKHYRQDGVQCVPEADIKAEFSGLGVPTGGIVRASLAAVSFVVNLTHMAGALIDVSDTSKQFHIEGFLSDKIPATNSTSILKAVTKVQETELPGITSLKSSSASINFNIDVTLSADHCPQIQYLCINMTTLAAAKFYEINETNNLFCQNISTHIVCKPPLDLSLTVDSYADTKPIARAITDNFTFNAIIKNPAGSHDVVALNQKANFQFHYFYHSTAQTDGTALGSINLTEGILSQADAGTDVTTGGTKTVKVIVTSSVTYEDCDTTVYLCLVFKDGSQASYTESNMADNVNCLDISAKKLCRPPTTLTVETFNTIPNDKKIIRGYNESISLSIIFKNSDLVYDVLQPKNGTNFNLTAYFASSSATISEVYNVTMDAQVANQSLPKGQSINVTSTLTILIKRDICSQITLFCARILPATGASFTVATGTGHIKCINIGVQLPCSGIKIENFATASAPYAVEKTSSPIDFKWTKGTDVVINFNFGDGGSYVWKWNENNHNTSYLDHVATANHVYSSMGTFTVTVTAQNAAGSETKTFLITVVPNLNLYLTTTFDHKPNIPPVDATFNIALKTGITVPALQANCTVTFDDRDNAVKNYSKAVTNADFPLTVSHKYTTEWSDSWAEVKCTNQKSVKKLRPAIVILQQNVTGLKIIPNIVYGPSNLTTVVPAYMDTGSDVFCTVDFGINNVSTFTYKHPEKMATKAPLMMQYRYNYTGTYNIQVSCHNKHFRDTANATVIIMDPVVNFTVSGSSTVTFRPGNLTLTVTQNPKPQNASCNFTIDGELILSKRADDFSLSGTEVFQLMIPTQFGGLNKTLNITCYNNGSRDSEIHKFDYHVRVENLTLDFKNVTLANKSMSLTMTLASGSNVTFEISYGDGTSKTVKHPDPSAAPSRKVTVQKTYSTAGAFLISVKAKNQINDVTNSSYIYVYHAITDISFAASNSSVWPPGNVVYTLISGTAQAILHNVTCYFNYASKWTERVFYTEIKPSTTVNITRQFSREYIGIIKTNITCTNQASNGTWTTTTEYILDAVILATLNSNGSVWWTNTSHFELKVKRFGTGACFLWNMGDGNTTMYGVATCQQNATQNGHKFILIPPGTLTIPHAHVYSNFGKYNTTVKGFNNVSDHILWTNTVVLDWPCDRPNISFTPDISDPSKPLEHMRSVKFNISVTYQINCTKTQQVQSSWEFVSSGNKVVLKLPNTTQFLHLPRTLPYGDFQVLHTASMLGVNDTDRTIKGYLKVTKTPLAINMTKKRTVVYDTVEEINAVKFTHDYDVTPGDKTGMVFAWSCVRTNESIFKSVVRTTSASHNGCLGDGKKELSQYAGQGSFKLNISLMQTMSTHEITVEVTKDTRSAKYTQEIYVTPMPSPVMNITCRLRNCASDRRIKGRIPIVLKTTCLKYCVSKYGPLTLVWKLYKVANGTKKEVKDLKQISMSGLTDPSLFIKANALLSGTEYIADIESSTPGTPVSTHSYKFLVNKPPYNGSCSVSPTTGKAAKTMYTIDCKNWLEWRPNVTGGYLRYDFRIQIPGSSQTFPLGLNDTGSITTVLPMGDLKDKKFNLEVVIHITDTLDDYTVYRTETKVGPQNLTEREMVNKLLVTARGKDGILPDLATSGQHMAMMTQIYAMLSEINVPSNLYLIPNFKSKTDEEEYFTNITRDQAKIRDLLAEFILKNPADSVTSFTQSCVTLNSLLSEPKETTAEQLQNVAMDLNKMTANFLDMQKQGKLVYPPQQATDLFSTIAKTMVAGDWQNKDINAKVKNNVTSSSDNTTIMSKEMISEAMKTSVQVLNTVMTALSQDKEANDPDNTFYLKDMGVVISKMSGDRVGNRSWNASQGFLKVPPTKKLFPNTVASCVDMKMVMLSVNPFIYGNQTGTQVNSSVVDFAMDVCSSKRKKRAAYNFNNSLAEANFSVGVKSYENSQLFYVNKTSIDPKGLLFHPLNITLPDTAVRITVLPEENQTYNIYFAMDKKPYPDTHKVVRTIARNSSDVVNIPSIVTDTRFTFYISAENLSIGTLYVGTQREDCFPKEDCTDQNEYYYQIMDVTCRTWRDDEELWKTEACKLDSVTESGDVLFKSNLFGSLAAGLFVGPNKIDFGTVFQNLDQKILDNIIVVATVIGIILLYFPCVIVCRQMDKKDSSKWQSILIVDNPLDAEYEYEIHIFTGSKKRAGTKSNVFVDIKGILGSTGPRALTDGSPQNFKQGQVNIFTIQTNEELGEVLNVNVWHDNSGKGDDGSWYLDKIVVVDKMEALWYVFWCNDWLAVEEGDGRLERHLVSENYDLTINNGVLMRNNIQRGIYDSHLWFSVVVRQAPSRFTRVQRLSVCLALLYLTMISNAMFYKTGEGNKSGSITIGPISLGVHEIYVSIVSSFIVIPPILLISILFAKAAQRPRKKEDSESEDEEHDPNELESYEFEEPTENWNSNNSNSNNWSDEDDLNAKEQKWKKKKPSLLLPWWTLYIGWVLVFLSVAASAFFVILYSFQWGRVKSTAWLAAFFLSFIESVILIQPLKVLMIAALLSFIFKRDTDMTPYEELYGKMTKVDYIDEDMGYGSHNSLSHQEMEMIRERRELDKKINSMVKEIITHFLLVLLFMAMCYINVDPRVYRQSQQLRQTFEPDEKELQSGDAVWKWLEHHLLENLYFTKQYNGNPVTPYDKLFLPEGHFRRLSPPRIRQLRAIPEPCRVYLTMKTLTKRCTEGYDLLKEDLMSYRNASWKAPLNASSASKAATEVVAGKMTDAYQYLVHVPAPLMDGLPYWGIFNTYRGGGYIANLGQDLHTAEKAVRKLKSLNWFDERTRAIFIEFNVYNTNTNLFTIVTVLFEVMTWGGIYPRVLAQTILLYRYNGAVGFIAIVIEIICLIWMIYKIVAIISSIVKLKSKFFQDFWNWVDASVIIALLFGFTFYVMRSYWTVKKVEQMMNNKEQSVNFSLVVFYDSFYMIGIGYATFFTIIRFLHILRYNKTISDLNATLAKGAWDMFILGLWGISMLIGFSVLIYTALGTKLHEYSSPGWCILNMVSTFLGHFDFEAVTTEGGNWGRVILLIYLLLMMFLIVNLFITVINETLADITEDDLPEDYKVLEHFLDTAKAFIFGFLKVGDQESKESDEETQDVHVDDVHVSPTLKRMTSTSQRPRTDSEVFNLYFMKRFSQLKSLPFSKDNEDADMMLLYILMSTDKQNMKTSKISRALTFIR